MPLLSPSSRQSQIFNDLHIRRGTVHGILKDPAQEGGTLILAQAGDILAVNQNCTGIHRPHAGYRIEHGGLASAIAANDGAEVTGLQGQVQILQCFLFVNGTCIEGLVYISDFQHLSALPVLLGRLGILLCDAAKGISLCSP